MKIRLPLLLACCFILLKSKSHNIDSALQFNAANMPVEKIYLHTDKETYLPGETLWYKAYIMSNDVPSAVSTNLYIDLLNDRGQLIAHKTAPIYNSAADGYFNLPDTFIAGYTLRVYTSWMLNFDTAFLYKKTIVMLGGNQASATADTIPASVRFFAEGGNFVAGMYNYVAFKSAYADGAPFDIKGNVQNSHNETVDSITVLHDGMGLTKFIPEANETYYAIWKDNTGTYRRTALPAVQPDGVLLHTEKMKQLLYYQVSTSTRAENLAQLTVMATMNQQLLYNAVIAMKEQTVTQQINTAAFPTGILTLTVLDKHNQPVAERIVFINNNNYAVQAQVQPGEKNTTKRGKNILTIQVPDTLATNLSLSVYDAGLEGTPSGRNICTDLLLQSELRGIVYNPSWYFEPSNDDAGKYIDLVMQTNGWRRYSWNQVLNFHIPEITFQRDNYLQVSGNVTAANRQQYAAQTINLLLQDADSSRHWYWATTDTMGRFTQRGLIFYDSAMIYYKLNNATKNNAAQNPAAAVQMNTADNGLLSLSILGRLPQYSFVAPGLHTINNGAGYAQYYYSEVKNKNPGFEQTPKLLAGVVIKKDSGWHNWKNDPIFKMDEKYTNMFRGVGASVITMDVLHDEMAPAKLDIYNYLIGKIPGFMPKFKSGEKMIDMPIYLNESLIDDQILKTIDWNDIAYIKFYQYTPWQPQLKNSLAIYTKKPEDKAIALKDIPSKLSRFTIRGYSPVKEFYSPDYSTSLQTKSADLRSTLYWQPYLFTNNKNQSATVTFYNNDITTRFKVVLEGMDEAGKLVHAEQIIE